MVKILKRLGLNETDVRERFMQAGCVYDEDVLKYVILKLQSALHLDDLVISKMLMQRPDLLASRSAVNKILGVQYAFNITRRSLSAMLGSPRVNKFEPEKDYLKRIQVEAGLSEEEMKNLILHSRITQKRPESSDILRNMQILEALGVERENINKSVAILTLHPIHLIDIVRLGIVYYENSDLHDFIYYHRYRQDRNRVYARMMAERNGEIRQGIVYLPDSEFLKYSGGVTDEQLLSKYKLNPESRVDLENEMQLNFPDRAKILECFEVEELAKLIDQSKIKNREESVNFEQDNRFVLSSKLCLSNAQIDDLVKLEPSLKVVSTELLLHNIKSLAYLVGKQNVKKVALAKPEYLVNDNNMLCDCLCDMFESSGMTRAQFGNALLCVSDVVVENELNVEPSEQDN